jgi:hypothetical protein
VFFDATKRIIGEQITVGMIGDGQRLTVFMIAQQELALVLGAPE